MSDVIRVALDHLTETTKFGEAIIEAQILNCAAYAIYSDQRWSVTNKPETVKQAEMTISLPELNREAHQLFAETYLDDQQDPGLFAECWQGSAAQRDCSNEMRMMLDMMLQEDQQINAQQKCKAEQPAA